MSRRGRIGAKMGSELVRSAALAGAIALTVTAYPSRGNAQSLLAADGLGLLSEPLDARSRALGGAGIGLSGSYLTERDPAASAGLLLSTATMTFQTGASSIEGGETAGHTRFPNIGVSYPYGGNVFAVRVASFLDQEWEAVSEQTLDIGGRSVNSVDRFRSTGGIARVTVGWSRQIVQSLSAGVTFGTYAGTTRRTFSRSLDPETVGSGVEAFTSGLRLQASGIVVGAGLGWDPIPLVHVAGAFTWSDDLKLSPSEGTAGREGVYRMPLELRGGGTVTLTSGLALHLGVTYADWSDTGADLAVGTTRDSAWSYGGGLEWSGGTLLGRTVPIRIGARHRDLPFDSNGDRATERSLSGGLGFDLVETETLPLARLEFGVERGSRKAGPLTEDYWRTTASVRVAAG